MTTAQGLSLLEFHDVLRAECNRGTCYPEAVELCKLSTALWSIELTRCNRELSDLETRREEKLTARVEEIVKELNSWSLPAVKITGIEWPDVRSGFGIRLLFASKRYNNFGGEGWNVPAL